MLVLLAVLALPTAATAGVFGGPETSVMLQTPSQTVPPPPNPTPIRPGRQAGVRRGTGEHPRDRADERPDDDPRDDHAVPPTTIAVPPPTTTAVAPPTTAGRRRRPTPRWPRSTRVPHRCRGSWRTPAPRASTCSRPSTPPRPPSTSPTRPSGEPIGCSPSWDADGDWLQVLVPVRPNNAVGMGARRHGRSHPGHRRDPREPRESRARVEARHRHGDDLTRGDRGAAARRRRRARTT